MTVQSKERYRRLVFEANLTNAGTNKNDDNKTAFEKSRRLLS